MTQQQALREMVARMRDFSAWTDRAKTPIPFNPLPSNEEVESNLPAIAAFIRARFPAVCSADKPAWETGGWKRVELDEAFSVLNIGTLEEGSNAR